MKKLLFLLGVLSIAVSSPWAYAGGAEVSGGADVFVCLERHPLLSVSYRHVYLADTYLLFKNRHNFLRFQTLNSVEVTAGISEALDRLHKGLATEVHKKQLSLHFQMVSHLEDLKDDFIRFVPVGCTKRQLAIQNWKEGTLKINKSLYQALSSPEKELFWVHEILIFLRQRSGNTTQIRKSIEFVTSHENFADFARKGLKDMSSSGPKKITLDEKLRVLRVALEIAYERTLKKNANSQKQFFKVAEDLLGSGLFYVDGGLSISETLEVLYGTESRWEVLAEKLSTMAYVGYAYDLDYSILMRNILLRIYKDDPKYHSILPTIPKWK